MFNRLPKKFNVSEIDRNAKIALQEGDFELYIQYITFYKYFIA